MAVAEEENMPVSVESLMEVPKPLLPLREPTDMQLGFVPSGMMPGDAAQSDRWMRETYGGRKGGGGSGRAVGRE